MYLYLISFVIVAYIFYHYYKLKNYWKFRGIPGPPPTYIIGNLHEHLNTKRVNVLQLQDWTKKYGKLYGMLEGERKMLVTTDLDFLHEVFVKKSDIFHGRRLTPLLGDVDDYSNFLVNVFNARGNRWKRLRTLANPIFNVVTLKTILPTVQDSVNEILKCIEETENLPINAYPFFQEFTIDVISRIALGQTSSALFNNEYLEIVRDIFEKRRETPPELLGFIFPFLIPIIKKLGFFFNISTAKYFTIAYGKLNAAVRERKKLRENRQAKEDSEFVDETRKRIDFIDLFLDLENQDIQGEKSEHFDKNRFKVEKKLSTYEVVAMCFVFLLAGYDTTATSIGYLVYLLAKNPSTQKKIQEEIDSICPNHDPSYEDLQQFKYLEAAMKESLRMYPLAARAASRQCMETTTVNGMKIEKDVYVTADVFTIHYDKELWGEDANEFKPERWLTDEKRHPMAWLPFGAGPRICLGMRLAYMEEKAFIIGLLKKFNIEKTSKTPEKLSLFGALVVAPESIDVKFVQRF